jgi:hypothetical protein
MCEASLPHSVKQQQSQLHHHNYDAKTNVSVHFGPPVTVNTLWEYPVPGVTGWVAFIPGVEGCMLKRPKETTSNTGVFEVLGKNEKIKGV